MPWRNNFDPTAREFNKTNEANRTDSWNVFYIGRNIFITLPEFLT